MILYVFLWFLLYLILGYAFVTATKSWFDQLVEDGKFESEIVQIVRFLTIVLWLPLLVSILFLGIKEWRDSIKKRNEE